ncbi:MAG: hypothetical protein ABIH41_01675 [Nanoarchaeota archaeon]
MSRDVESVVCWAAIAVMLLAWSFVSVGFGARFDEPVGADYDLHMRLAQDYLEGSPAFLDASVIKENGGPYPPLFHMVLAAGILLGISTFVGLLLQALFIPLAMLLTALLVRRFVGLRAAVLSLVVLSASLAFIDRTQVTPQGMDMVLLPMIIWTSLADRWKWTVALTALSIWSHGGYAFCILLGLVLMCLTGRKTKSCLNKVVLWTAALSSPIIVLTIWFLPSYLIASAGTNSIQESLMLAHPTSFFLYISLPIIAAIIASAARQWFATWTPLERAAWMMVAAFIPILVFFPDRFASYVAIPAAILAGTLEPAMTSRRPWGRTAFWCLVAAVSAYALFNNYIIWVHLLLGQGPYIIQT